MEEEKEFKDIKLGASFAYEGVIYECRFTGSCDGNEREDATDVIFVEVKPENEQK